MNEDQDAIMNSINNHKKTQIHSDLERRKKEQLDQTKENNAKIGKNIIEEIPPNYESFENQIRDLNILTEIDPISEENLGKTKLKT